MGKGMGPGGAKGMPAPGQQAAGNQNPNAQNRDKLKHYQIKRIDFFIIAFQNKFRTQFKQLIGLRTLGQSQNEIDHLNLRTTYSFFLKVIENLLENDPTLRNSVQ